MVSQYQIKLLFPAGHPNHTRIGQGIYSSPDPTFSLMYTNFRRRTTKFNEFAGLKLIACAMISGRCRFMTREDDWRSQTIPFPGAHCHAANDLLEYVVFDEAQIIPCYVIHLDLGRDAAHYLTKLSLNVTDYINEYGEKHRKRKYAQAKLAPRVLAPGDKVRQKQALLSKARKYFPYGFGAAKGDKFVVEDVAEVSEDEEEYGVYQKDRVDGVELADTDIWAEDGYSTFAMDSDCDGFDDWEDGDDDDADEPADTKRVPEHEEHQEAIDWEYEMGPEGRTKFDEYYEARKAKSKNKMELPNRRHW